MKTNQKPKRQQIPLFVAMLTYFSFALSIIFGRIRDFFGWLFGRSRYLATIPEKGYAPLLKSWENFYTRRLYHRIQDCWNRPISSNPGAMIDVMERKTDDNNKTLYTTGNVIRCLNLGSYNYLGFGDDWVETCKEGVMPALESLPIGLSSSRVDCGTTVHHLELESLLATFLGKEDVIVFNMGYGTNATTIPALAGRGSLIISDELNHTSIVNGSRSSGAHIRVFHHNDADDLERVLREAIALGMPRTRRPWKKILVMVEGIYSMEGEIVDLKNIVRVCKKYKAYLYLDEAHSIGALGPTGRGACEYRGVDPKDIDVLMGTFTKSFGGMGGYIAGSKEMISALRARSYGVMYHNTMSPIVCRQVLTALKIIMGLDGTNRGAEKLRRLRENSNYFRQELINMGLHIYGDFDSPVIPMLIYVPGKIAAFSRECLERNLAVVVVGFPATSLVYSRSRFCISASHTREQLEDAIEKIREVTELIQLRYSLNFLGCKQWL